jgi:hypothetical protein
MATITVKYKKINYRLPQAGIIAQELLKEQLAKYGYHQSKIIPGFCSHKTRPICFTLVVDDFTIKYINEVDATHLIDALIRDNTITVDKEATKYIGLTIEWDYKNGKVHTYMPGYLKKAMIRFGHEKPSKIQNSQHPHKITQYGTQIQYAEEEDESPPLNIEETKYVQAVTGTLLYYGRAVDSTILTSISSLTTEQAKLMQKTMETVKQLLDYCRGNNC